MKTFTFIVFSRQGFATTTLVAEGTDQKKAFRNAMSGWVFEMEGTIMEDYSNTELDEAIAEMIENEELYLVAAFEGTPIQLENETELEEV